MTHPTASRTSDIVGKEDTPFFIPTKESCEDFVYSLNISDRADLDDCKKMANELYAFCLAIIQKNINSLSISYKSSDPTTDPK